MERERKILELAQKHAHGFEVPFTSLVVIGRRIASSTLETARTRNCGLILMGWKGYTNTADKILGEVADAVVKNVRTDLMLVKLTGDSLSKKLLLPTAGGQHATRAETYAASLATSEGSSVTVASVVGLGADADTRQKSTTLLEGASSRLAAAKVTQVDTQLIESDTVAEGIVEAGKDYDAIVVGATRQPWFREFFFGNIPYQIAQGSDKTVILVKNDNRVKGFISRTLG